ncbi:MAG: hypothetical protein NWE93_12450 [Candidatus Bathyarchaeota archaeon]|nr:hypothetical protein [Candidatus Bathyarchaeota archaeon]
MDRKRILQLAAVLLAAAVVLSGASAVQNSPTLQVNDGTQVSVQPANVLWQKTYGGAGDDRAFFMLPIGEGFLLVGSTASVGNVTLGWAMRLDSDGNQLWNHTYLDDVSGEVRYAVALCDGFLLVGNIFRGADVDGWAAKTDFDGNTLWQTTLHSDMVDKLFCGNAAADGFVLYGLTYSGVSSEVSKAWLVKLADDGSILWERSFIDRGALRYGVIAHDGTYTAAGYLDLGDGNYDFLLLNVTPDGNLHWNQTYGGAESQKAYCLTLANDGYVLVGESGSTATSTDAWLLKVDSSGQTEWSKVVGGAQADSPAYVAGASDGGFLVCGFSFSFGGGQRDFWLLKVSDSGQVLWSCTVGDEAFQEAYGVYEVSDGIYVLAGWTDPPNRPDLVGQKTYEFYAAKIQAPSSGSFYNLPWIVACVGFSVGLAFCVVLLLRLAGKPKK